MPLFTCYSARSCICIYMTIQNQHAADINVTRCAPRGHMKMFLIMLLLNEADASLLFSDAINDSK